MLAGFMYAHDYQQLNSMYPEPHHCQTASPTESYTNYPASYAAILDDSSQTYTDENSAMHAYESTAGTYVQYASAFPADYREPDYSAHSGHLPPPVHSGLEYGYVYADPTTDTTPCSASPARPIPTSSFSTLDHPSHRVANQVESGQDRAQRVDQGQPVADEVIARSPLFGHFINNLSDVVY